MQREATNDYQILIRARYFSLNKMACIRRILFSSTLNPHTLFNVKNIAR